MSTGVMGKPLGMALTIPTNFPLRGASRPVLVLVSSAANLMNPSFRSTWPNVKLIVKGKY